MADDDDFDVDKYLRLEANTFNQDQEVDRILKLHTQTRNPLEILDHPPSVFITLQVDERAVKVSYRKRSLLLHPDKCKHPRAQETFEILKKAESELMDEEKRKTLIGFVTDARDGIFQKRGIKGPVVVTEERWKTMMNDKELIAAIRMETRRMFAEDESRIKMRMKNEFDRRAAEAEQKLQERKQKQEHDKLWEETREERVGNWRQFMKKGAKKKKRKEPY
ncbi:hypothetical protein SpCBS45565_g05333 [Spizellomyces sp. 'palustris']|nr:hypothetical protein SpCBS45565_g05333 [Spizellomyces sp. 'palustris']